MTGSYFQEVVALFLLQLLMQETFLTSLIHTFLRLLYTGSVFCDKILMSNSRVVCRGQRQQYKKDKKKSWIIFFPRDLLAVALIRLVREIPMNNSKLGGRGKRSRACGSAEPKRSWRIHCVSLWDRKRRIGSIFVSSWRNLLFVGGALGSGSDSRSRRDYIEGVGNVLKSIPTFLKILSVRNMKKHYQQMFSCRQCAGVRTFHPCYVALFQVPLIHARIFKSYPVLTTRLGEASTSVPVFCCMSYSSCNRMFLKLKGNV